MILANFPDQYALFYLTGDNRVSGVLPKNYKHNH
jgi:hypothetical protein